MNELTAELHAISLELAAAGVFSTVDPGEVLNLVQRGGVCALVEPADEYQLGFGMASIDMSVPVRIITAGPYDMASGERLDAALILALPVAQPLEPVTRDTWDAADTDMPSLRLTARRRIPYPLTVHP